VEGNELVASADSIECLLDQLGDERRLLDWRVVTRAGNRGAPGLIARFENAALLRGRDRVATSSATLTLPASADPPAMSQILVLRDGGAPGITRRRT
jgi:hypothetical protein